MFFSGCDKLNSDKSGKIITLKSMTESHVTVNSDETYTLEATLEGEGFQLTISMKNTELCFKEGTYETVSDPSAGCKVSVYDGTTNRNITNGTVKIKKAGEGYEIYADLHTKLTSYRFSYEGEIIFEVNLKISENTVFISESDLTVYNSSWQPEVVAGVKKYILTVLSPSDKALASIEIVNAPGKTLAELEGEYAVRSNSTSSGTVVAGTVSWGSGSGSWYLDSTGNEQYITAGLIRISMMEDGESGIRYYTITGTNLSITSLAGKNGSGSLQHENVPEIEFDGTVLRNKTVASTAMGKEMKYSIYLPSDYEGSEEFPVLYLLHGYGDENNAWIDKGMLVKTAYSYEKNSGRQMVVVCPDGLTTFYYDSQDTKFETYFFNELVPEIEKTYKVKTDRNSRAVAGLSMGGYGTLYYGLKYPEMFCYAYACSAAIDMGADYPSLYGLVTDADPSALPGITLEMGTEDYTTGNGANFHNALNNAGIQHEYIARSGSHDWKFWQECLPKVLKKCGEAFKN